MAVSVATINPNLKFVNTIDGLNISWDDLSQLDNFVKYLLLRKRYDYPSNVTDGDVILSGTQNSVKDMTAENGRSYYYKLYVVIQKTLPTGEPYDDYMTAIQFKKVVIVHKLDKSANKMYDSLPSLYRTDDILALETYKQSLPQPLHRYLSLMGYQFDKVNNLVDLILDNIDIDTCDEKFLPYLAKWLGVEYDWSISVSENRMFIKVMIENYSRKGTYEGLKTLIQNISKSKVEILVDKTKTPVHASQTAINLRRTIDVEIYLDSESDSWVGTKQEKVLKVVSQNVPKKNAYTVRVVVLIDFWDVYLKDPRERQRADKLIINTRDNYLGAKDINLFDKINIKSDVDKYLKTSDIDPEVTFVDGMRGMSLRGYNLRGVIPHKSNWWDVIGYGTEYDTYKKKIRETHAVDITYLNTDKDVYLTSAIDDFYLNNLLTNYDIDKYNKTSNIDPDIVFIDGVRSTSKRGYNLRGKAPNSANWWDEVRYQTTYDKYNRKVKELQFTDVTSYSAKDIYVKHITDESIDIPVFSNNDVYVKTVTDNNVIPCQVTTKHNDNVSRIKSDEFIDTIKLNLGNDIASKIKSDNSSDKINIKSDVDKYLKITSDKDVVPYSLMMNYKDTINRIKSDEFTDIINLNLGKDIVPKIKSDNIVDMIASNDNDKYNKRVKDSDFYDGSIRGVSYRGVNVRGEIPRLVDVIYNKSGAFVEARYYS